MMKRTRLKSKEGTKLLENYGIILSKKDQVELHDSEYKILVINSEPAFFYYKEKY